MGCDIHMYVERKVGGKWWNADYFVPNPSWKPDEWGRAPIPKYHHVKIYGNRNYALFATLANVRNYGNTDYISEPKGLPDDVTEFVKSEWETWEFDGHSCSWLTLRELIDFHEARHPLKRRGMLSPEQQAELDDGILPDHWCQGCNQAGYEFREWEEDNDVLVPLINKLKERCDDLNMIYDFAWDSSNEAMRGSAYRKAADIRIVFWFDN